MEQYLLEIGFNSIEESVVCGLCVTLLTSYFNIAKACRSTEEKVVRYSEHYGTTSKGLIPLNGLLSFSCDDDFKCAVNSSQVDVKMEEITIEDTLLDHDRIGMGKKHAYQTEGYRSYMNSYKSETDIQKPKYELSVNPMLQNEDFCLHKCLLCNHDSKETKCPNGHNMESHFDILDSASDNCESCKFKCSYKECLASHLQLHKDNSFSLKRRVIHKEDSDVKMYLCDLCEFKTKHKRNLQRHQRIHKDSSELELFTCEICKFKTKYKHDLKTHAIIHKDKSEVEIYKCEMCGYESKHKIRLQRHLLIHKDISEVEMFKCETCDFKTKYKSCIKSHVLKHKDDSEVEIFECTKCDYKTKHKSGLKVHLLVHKDLSEVKMYKCETCDFETKHKRGLKMHLLVHKDLSEVKMYECEKCDYKTKRRRSLKVHLLVHTDSSELMHKCGVCTFKTKRRWGLKAHMLTVHRDTFEEKTG